MHPTVIGQILAHLGQAEQASGVSADLTAAPYYSKTQPACKIAIDGYSDCGDYRRMGKRGNFLAYLIACCAGWIQRQQAEAIEYLKAENRTLRERLGGRRLIFTHAERRLLARKAIAVGRRRLLELDPIVTPDTVLRWHRELVARKWTDLELTCRLSSDHFILGRWPLTGRLMTMSS